MTREEAIKAIKAWDFLNNDEKEVIETLIPELAKSEDERIRKELIQFIENWKDPNNIGRQHDFPTLTRNVEQCDKYLAWLEKQGEKRSVFPKFRVGDTIQSCFNKQAIDKVIRIDDDIYILSSGGHVRIEFQDNWKLVEQKPEWSEEEKTYQSYILTNCMHYADAMGYVDEKKNNQLHKKAENWLKSLKDRVQLRPKQEWSEENEYNLLSAIKKLEKLAEYEKRVAERDNWERTYVLIDWLKSLKDRIGGIK